MKKLVLALAMIGAVGGANASSITVVNGAGAQDLLYGTSVVNPTVTSHTIDYVYGGLMKFVLSNPTNPVNTPVTYTLKSGASEVATWTMDNDLSTLAKDIFQISLAGGVYTLDIVGAARSAVTEVSAVPLPAAALLFGSSLLGAGALRRKQKAGKEVVAV